MLGYCGGWRFMVPQGTGPTVLPLMSRLPTHPDDPVKFDPRVDDLLGVVGHQDNFAGPVPAKAAGERHPFPPIETAQPVPERINPLFWTSQAFSKVFIVQRFMPALN